MSTGKMNNLQLGQSGTATQNFTISTGGDGSMKLARGNQGATTQDVLTVDPAGVVKLPAGSQIPGVGQTWQNVTASRAYAQSYNNLTDKPITVLLSCSPAGAGSQNVTITVGGVNIGTISTTNGSAAGNATFIVPPNTSYSVSGTNSTLVNWSELR